MGSVRLRDSSAGSLGSLRRRAGTRYRCHGVPGPSPCIHAVTPPESGSAEARYLRCWQYARRVIAVARKPGFENFYARIKCASILCRGARPSPAVALPGSVGLAFSNLLSSVKLGRNLPNSRPMFGTLQGTATNRYSIVTFCCLIASSQFVLRRSLPCRLTPLNRRFLQRAAQS